MLAIAPAAMASDVDEATIMTAELYEVSRPNECAATALVCHHRLQPLRHISRPQPRHCGRSSKLNYPFKDVEDPSDGRYYEYMALKIPFAPRGDAGESRWGRSVRRRGLRCRSKRTRTLHLRRFQSRRRETGRGIARMHPLGPAIAFTPIVEEVKWACVRGRCVHWASREGRHRYVGLPW